MRIAVISDIHGNRPALEAVEADIARLGVDATINLKPDVQFFSIDFATSLGNLRQSVLNQALSTETGFNCHNQQLVKLV